MRCILNRKSLRVFCLLWLCLLLGLLCATVCSAEQTYRITEQELTTLENRFQVVKANNILLQDKLEKLNNKLTTLEALSQTQETQLQTLNKSFEVYAKEVKAKQKRLRWQRNISYFVVAGTLCLLMNK